MEMNKVFKDGLWSKEINVSDFVHTNITPYEAMPHFWQAPQSELKSVERMPQGTRRRTCQ